MHEIEEECLLYSIFDTLLMLLHMCRFFYVNLILFFNEK